MNAMTNQANAAQISRGDIELIALPEVRRISGMGTTYIYGQMAAGKFPRQRKIGKKASRWVKSEVQAWVMDQLGDSNSASR